MKSFATVARLALGVGQFTRRRGKRFYVLLAAVISLLAVLDFAVTHVIGGMEGQAYDFVIRHRLGSPPADPGIVIVEIDERSLEQVGRDHGRWPWPRSVLAEALATMADAGAAGVYVNVLLSEPDPQRPDADEVLAGVAASYPSISFAMTRLAEENDPLSRVDAAMVPGAVAQPGASAGPDPVAIIVPFRAEMQTAMGVNNLTVDDDGIVRSYRYGWLTRTHVLPSAAARLAGDTGAALDAEPQLLNWRNKAGDGYRRLSFADLYAGMTTGKGIDWKVFKGKRVILGVTAPGISVLKPTSARALTDDNEILATAVDDRLNGTSLHTLPSWVYLLVSVLIIAVICVGFLSAVDQDLIDGLFAAGQVALLALTLLSVSYSHTLVDLTQPFTFGMIYFSAARVYSFAMSTSLRGSSLMWAHEEAVGADRAWLLFGEMTRAIRAHLTDMLQRWAAEKGPHAFLYYDNAIGGLAGLNDALAECDVAILFLPPAASATDAETRHVLEAFAAAHALLLKEVPLAGVDDVDALRNRLAGEVFRLAGTVLER